MRFEASNRRRGGSCRRRDRAADGDEFIADDRHHKFAVLWRENQRDADVAQPLENVGSLRQHVRRLHVPPMPGHAGIALRLAAAEPLDVDAARLASAEEIQEALLRQTRNRELQRALDIGFLLRPVR